MSYAAFAPMSEATARNRQRLALLSENERLRAEVEAQHQLLLRCYTQLPVSASVTYGDLIVDNAQARCRGRSLIEGRG
jgi:hypothetical protein